MDRRAVTIIAASVMAAHGTASAAQFDIRLCNLTVPPQFKRMDIKFVSHRDTTTGHGRSLIESIDRTPWRCDPSL